MLAFSVSAYSAEYIISASAPGVYKEAARVDRLRSCLEILKANPLSESGSYTIKPDGVDIGVYCDMKSMGGGWTLLDASEARSQKSLTKYAGLARISTEIAYGGSQSTSDMNLASMQYGMAFKIPNPSIVTFDDSGNSDNAVNSVPMQYISNFGTLSSKMYIAPAYYASKYSLGFKYNTYHHYGVTEFLNMSNYQTRAFSNSMGNDGYAMSLANNSYHNNGYFFVYLR